MRTRQGSATYKGEQLQSNDKRDHSRICTSTFLRPCQTCVNKHELLKIQPTPNMARFFHMCLLFAVFHSSVAGLVKYGRYRIIGCSSTEASSLKTLLTTLRYILPNAIADAQTSPIKTSRAFNTFFHNPVAAGHRVAELLTNITYGTAMYPTDTTWSYDDGTELEIPGSPAFLCVNEPKVAYLEGSPEQSNDYFYWCGNNTNTVMDYPGGNQFIIICPQFWTVGLPKYPHGNNCLTVNKLTERFRGTGARVSHFMLWVVLEELAHFYINAGRGATQDVSDVNKCVKLSWREAMWNSASYLYYVASKSFSNSSPLSNPKVVCFKRRDPVGAMWAKVKERGMAH